MSKGANSMKRIACLSVLCILGVVINQNLLTVSSYAQARPDIMNITPSAGVPGMAVTIIGRNFGTIPGRVLFNGREANFRHPNGHWWSDSRIVVQVPPGEGAADVTMETAQGMSVTIGMGFKYLDIPVVTEWRAPVDNPYVIQRYDNPNPRASYKRHTGLDLSNCPKDASGGCSSPVSAAPVFAAADGIVVARCPDGQDCLGFSRDPGPIIDNHGMNGVVILAHRLPIGFLVYSLYAHLADVSFTPAPGQRVNPGERLGTTGLMYYDGRWLNHVHFEIKDGPTLHNPTWIPKAPAWWGYTPDSPDDYGYRNPQAFISQPPSPRVTTATVLVMDVSGSMGQSWKGGIKLESAKNAAQRTIDLIEHEIKTTGSEHHIAIVTFSDDDLPPRTGPG
jgi:hypothetical protein